MSTQCKYREVKGHPTSRAVLFSDNETRLLLFNLDSLDSVIEVPIRPDSGARFHFHRGTGFCLVGSWRRGLQCFDTATGRVVWEDTRFAKIDDVQVVEERGAFLLKGDTSLLIEARSGHVLRQWPHRQVWIHPTKDFTVTTKRGCGAIALANDLSGDSWEFEWDSFAVLCTAWGKNTVACSSPTGQLAVACLETGKVMSMLKKPDWFNVLRLSFNLHTSRFYGVATGWKHTPQLCLFSIDEFNQDFQVINNLDHASGFDFLNHGTELVTTDGNLFSTNSGELVVKGI